MRPLTARNPGLIDAVVASHEIRLLPAGAAIVLPGSPYGELPGRLRAGDSLTWAYPLTRSYPLTALHGPVVALEANGHTVTDLCC